MSSKVASGFARGRSVNVTRLGVIGLGMGLVGGIAWKRWHWKQQRIRAEWYEHEWPKVAEQGYQRRQKVIAFLKAQAAADGGDDDDE